MHLFVGVVGVEQRDVVAVRVCELRLGLVRRLGRLLGPHVHVGRRQHGRYGQGLVAAAELGGRHQHLGQLGVQRELRHLLAHLGERGWRAGA